MPTSLLHAGVLSNLILTFLSSDTGAGNNSYSLHCPLPSETFSCYAEGLWFALGLLPLVLWLPVLLVAYPETPMPSPVLRSHLPPPLFPSSLIYFELIFVCGIRQGPIPLSCTMCIILVIISYMKTSLFLIELLSFSIKYGRLKQQLYIFLPQSPKCPLFGVMASFILHGDGNAMVPLPPAPPPRRLPGLPHAGGSHRKALHRVRPLLGTYYFHVSLPALVL